MATSVKMSISLPQRVAEFIEGEAAKRQKPRSAVVAELLEEKRRQLFEEELAQAYLEMAEDDQEFAERAFPLQAEVVLRDAPYDAEAARDS